MEPYFPFFLRCHCTTNWYGVHCTQSQDVCQGGSDLAICGHGTCSMGSNAQRQCTCSQGWSKDNDGRCSVDVNECTGNSNPCSRDPPVRCLNTQGGFRCGPCSAGFTGDGYFCDDINECLTQGNNGGCSMNPPVACYNSRGGRTCGPCPPGYQGDGQTCTFLGPCHVSNGGCHPMAVCFSTGAAGMVQCYCRHGFTGLGIGPMGCVPGSSGPGPNLPPSSSSSDGSGQVVMSPCASGPCLNGGTCIPLATSFVCNCPLGYSGFMCQNQIDNCANRPCLNGGTCVNGLGTHTCQCSASFTGDNCRDEVQGKILK
jgi:cubilin